MNCTPTNGTSTVLVMPVGCSQTMGNNAMMLSMIMRSRHVQPVAEITLERDWQGAKMLVLPDALVQGWLDRPETNGGICVLLREQEPSSTKTNLVTFSGAESGYWRFQPYLNISLKAY
jgi:hypothetical protein